MKRHLKSTAIFATVVSLSLVASEVRASTPTTRKHTASNFSNKLQKQGGLGTTTQPPTQTNPAPTPTPAYPYRMPAGGWKVYGGIFNQPAKPTFPYRVPPGGWKVYGNIFGNNAPPTTPPSKPPMGNGRGHGLGGGSFAGGIGGGTVVTTTTTVGDPAAAPTAAPSAAPATVTADSAANELQLAAGSSFTLKGEKFGHQEGRVGVIVGTILIPIEVTHWSDNAITVTVPPVGVSSAAKAMFSVERADGSMAKEMHFDLVAAK